MNKMRVIDLLNKKANGEKMPEKIVIYPKYEKSFGMELSSSMRNYKDGDGDLLFSSDYNWIDMLNYEVEVIEEPNVKIDKAIEYMENYIEVEDAPINERIKEEFKEVLKILKSENYNK